MDARRTETSDTESAKAWWESYWGWVLTGLILGACSIVVRSHGYGGLFDWFVVFAAGIGMAVVAFWERRSRVWFWPAVTLLVVAHGVVLFSHEWRLLVMWTEIWGAAGLDFAICALFLYGLHALFDPPEAKPGWGRVETAIVWSLVALAVGIFGFAAVVMEQARNDKLAQLEAVFVRDTSREMQDLMECIDDHRARREMWGRVKADDPTRELFYQLSGLRILLTDIGGERVVQVETVRGRPLRETETEFLNRCL